MVKFKILPVKLIVLAVIFLIIHINPVLFSQETKEITSDFTISGKVRYNAGAGFKNFSGAEINVPGVGTAIASAAGNYSIKVPVGYSGTITPIVCDESYYSFDPPSITLTNVQANISGNSFDATVTTMFTISGTITEKTTGEPLSNMEIDFLTATRYGHNSYIYKITPNAQGEYSFDVLPCWTNPVDPKLSNHYFESTDGGFIRNYNEVSSDFPNNDYTFINFEYPIPDEFEYLITGTGHTISVEGNSNPGICGTPIELGDLIGAFYLDDYGELKCGGFGRWHDEYTETNVSVAAMGDDTGATGTPEKDGFAYAETITWFVYSYTRDEIFPATPTYKTGGVLTSNNKWYPGGLSIMSNLAIKYANPITIPEGWSGISSFTPPSSIPIANVMAPILDDLVLIQSTTGMYYPEMGINNLFTWNANKGYKIKVNNQTFLPMPGCPLTNRTVSLTTGWNLMPVLTQCNVLVTEALAPIMSRIIVIKEVAGNKIFWPAMGIETLKILESNRAYYILVTQNSSFTYSLCEGYKSVGIPELSPETNNTEWNDPVKSGFTHTIGILADAFDIAEPGDYIGVFTQEDICAGLMLVNDSGNPEVLTVYGDDFLENINTGFSEGEILQFKLYKTKTGEVAALLPKYDTEYPANDGNYSYNGVSVIKSMEIVAPGISAPENLVGFFPNPTSGKVQFVTPFGGTFNIKLQDMAGKILETSTISGTTALNYSNYPRGVYVLVIESDNYRDIKKLILR